MPYTTATPDIMIRHPTMGSPISMGVTRRLAMTAELILSNPPHPLMGCTISHLRPPHRHRTRSSMEHRHLHLDLARVGSMVMVVCFHLTQTPTFPSRARDIRHQCRQIRSCLIPPF